MKLDTRAIVITITITVIVLGVATWLLVQPALDNDPAAATTSRGLGSTTSSPFTTTTVPNTTVSTGGQTTSQAATTTTAAPTSTRSSEATTTTAATTTSSDGPPTTTLDFEPDVSLCEANDLAPTKCRWVDRVHPPINIDPREDPHEYLLQFMAFFEWSLANPSEGRDLGFIAFGGDLLPQKTAERRDQIEQGRIVLDRLSVEEATVIESTDERVELHATLVAGESHVVVKGQVVESYDPASRGVWRFVAELQDGSWKMTEEGIVE